MKAVEYRKLLFTVVVVIFVFACGYMDTSDRKAVTNTNTNKANPDQQLSQKEKLDDFEYMYSVLKENYPFFEVNKRVNNVDWLSRKQEYIKKIKATKSDTEFYTALNNIVKELNNKHTYIMNQSEYLYQKELSSGSDGVNEPWYTELNNKKTQTRYINKWKDTIDNAQSSLSSSENSNGDKNIRTEILIKNKAAYLSIKVFDTRNIDEDMKIIKSFLSGIKNYKALIIDIRGNPGGDYSYWRDNLVPLIIRKTLTEREYYVYRGGNYSEKFMKAVLGDHYSDLQPVTAMDKLELNNMPPEIKKDFKYYINFDNIISPKNSINFRGKIYLLVDRYVYSSSESFATFAKHTGFAAVVGEKTGGDGIGQTPLVCSLPNSGYVLNFSYVMGLASDGICDEEYKTEPDIKVDDASVNTDLNNDKTVQTVLKLIKSGR